MKTRKILAITLILALMVVSLTACGSSSSSAPASASAPPAAVSVKENTPKTTEVLGLHNILIKAIELRKEAYAKLLQVLTNNATEADVNAAFAKLDESDATFLEFLTKGETMKKDLGLADAK